MFGIYTWSSNSKMVYLLIPPPQVTIDERTRSLNVAVMVPRDSASLLNTAGLLGSANGIPGDDFAVRNESILSPQSFTDYHMFGMDCKSL